MATRGYRRSRGHPTGEWHFCSNCTRWPRLNYESPRGDQEPDPVCEHCLDLERRQMCVSQETYL